MSNPLSAALNNCIRIAQSLWAQPCLLCGARSKLGLLCSACEADLPRLPAEHCPRCALPTPGGNVCGACLKTPPHFSRTHAVYIYGHPADILVQALKYRGELALAPYLASQLAAVVRDEPPPDLIIPMPLHARRLRERGFNQAGEIARHLARHLGTLHELGGCQRVRDTPPQVSQPLKERHKNIRAAFTCECDLRGLRVALVDDVMTSGASLNELAATTLKAGAQEVEAWVVARALKA